MSEIAGQKAVEKVMEYYALRRICPSKIIISGAGAVGSSVVRKLVEISTDSIKFDIKVIDPDESKSGIFKTLNRSQCKIEVVTADKITEYDLSGADALILAAYIKGRPAPKVVSCHELRQMKDYAIIVDVAIDEGSGIDGVPPLQKDESRDAAVKSFIQSKLQEKHLNVIADSHLPRLSPAEASITHGNNVLPYLAVLLYLSAKEGGAISAVRYLHREVRKRIDASASSDASDSMFGELDFDLLNGLAYIVHDGYIVDCRGHLAKRSVHDLMEISLGGILEHPQITRLNPGT
jgi:hypothetical protein